MSTPETAKILVVDDAPVVRLYHRHILEQAGYEVAEAENGLVAIEMALQGAFDLAIVDVNMPVMDGYTFMHRLRATSGISAMPVPGSTITSRSSTTSHTAGSLPSSRRR